MSAPKISIKNYIGAKFGEDATIEDIKRIYLEDDRPIYCAYSGGKDSSVALDLVLKALLRVSDPVKPVYVLFSDTLMEMDPVIGDIDKSFDELKAFAKEHNLPLVINRVEPLAKESFWSLLIGAGYTLPKTGSSGKKGTGNRWCTNRLKIRPQERAIKKMIDKFGGFISVTGQRRAESAERAERMEKSTIPGSLLKSHDQKNCNLYTPIEFYSSDDVWDYIYTRSLDWLNANRLGKQYADAAGEDGAECRTLLEGIEGEQAGCSKSARYGCWVCPLFQRDKTLNNLATHYKYLGDLENFRNWLIDYAREVGWNDRDVYMHGKNIQNIYDKGNHRDGMNIPGGLTLSFRKKILKKLIELEERVMPFRGKPLISDEELSYIQERWIEEGESELYVYQVAPHRNFDISDKHKEALEALLVYKKKFYKDQSIKAGERTIAQYEWESVNGININADGRYYAQLSLQLQKAGKDPVYYAKLLTDSLPNEVLSAAKPVYLTKNELLRALKYQALDLIKTLPVETKQYYPSATEEEYVRWEWKNDRVGMINIYQRYLRGELDKPDPTLFGYEGEFGLHFEQIDELEEVGDITMCESISLRDQMAYFDNWNEIKDL